MKWFLGALALAVLSTETQAGPLKRLFGVGHQKATCSGSNCGATFQQQSFQQQSSTQFTPTGVVQTTAQSSSSVKVTVSDGTDALDEVNAKRAERGLRPFLRDPLLTSAAYATAQFRAARGLFGHTTNDFAFLPPGGSARAAGCAAWPASMGWGSCCTYESHTYAGAAFVIGADGRRYMHLFVR